MREKIFLNLYMRWKKISKRQYSLNTKLFWRTWAEIIHSFFNLFWKVPSSLFLHWLVNLKSLHSKQFFSSKLNSNYIHQRSSGSKNFASYSIFKLYLKFRFWNQVYKSNSLSRVLVIRFSTIENKSNNQY